jgi:hypothetical protein
LSQLHPDQEKHRERVAAAGGELLGAAFKFLGELVAQDATTAAPPAELVANLRGGLEACVDSNGDGPPKLTIALPDRSALDELSQTLARLLMVNGTNGAAAGANPPAINRMNLSEPAPRSG